MKYKLEWRSFLVLKATVLVAWFLIWNILLGIAIYINDGFGPVTNPVSAYLAAIALIGTSVFCCLLINNEHFRKSMLHPERGISFERWPFGFVGVLTFVLGLLACITAY